MYTPKFQNFEKNHIFADISALGICFKTLYWLCIVNSYLKSDFDQDFNLECLKKYASIAFNRAENKNFGPN